MWEREGDVDGGREIRIERVIKGVEDCQEVSDKSKCGSRGNRMKLQREKRKKLSEREVTLCAYMI